MKQYTLKDGQGCRHCWYYRVCVGTHYFASNMFRLEWLEIKSRVIVIGCARNIIQG